MNKFYITSSQPDDKTPDFAAAELIARTEMLDGGRGKRYIYQLVATVSLADTALVTETVS